MLAPPYDVISPAERETLAREPENVVHLELPLDEEGEGSRYRVAARRLDEWLAGGFLRRDEQPILYAYSQRFEHRGRRRERRGCFGLVELVPPGQAGRVFPHEFTLRGPREDRLELLRATRANLSPVFLLYEDASGFVQEAQEGALNSAPLARAQTPWGTVEALAAFGGKAAGEAAVRLSESDLVFADGHHRYESALRYHEEQLAAGSQNTPTEEAGEWTHGYALAVFVERTDPGLVVLATHRMVRGPARAGEEWARTLESSFDVKRFAWDSGSESARRDALAWLEDRRRQGRTAFVCAFRGEPRYLGLVLRPEAREALFESVPSLVQPLRELDVTVLHALLEAGLGITSEAVGEQGALAYTHDAEAALKAVEGDAGAAFVMNPTPVQQVMRVASRGYRLPQKTTYFHPKLSSGWLFHVHEDPRVVWGEGAAGPGRHRVAARMQASSEENA